MSVTRRSPCVRYSHARCEVERCSLPNALHIGTRVLLLACCRQLPRYLDIWILSSNTIDPFPLRFEEQLDMTYTEFGPFTPATFLYCLIGAIGDPNYMKFHATIPYLCALRTHVIRERSNFQDITLSPEVRGRYAALVADHRGLRIVFEHIANVHEDGYTKPIGRFLEDVLGGLDDLAGDRYADEMFAGFVRKAQEKVAEFHGSDALWMLEDDGGYTITLDSFKGDVLSRYKRHVRSLEVCVEGLGVWVEMLQKIEGPRKWVKRISGYMQRGRRYQ